jgi:predicted MPP superfamily phosphohydrolase
MLIFFIIVAALSLLFYKGYKNTKQVAVNNIYINQTGNKVGKPFRVLQISDMHLENISVTPENLLATLKGQEIDLIALTGDYLDRKRTIPKLLPYLKVFNELAPKYGIYAVFGNHDYVLRSPYFDKLKQLLDDNGVKTLVNENAVIWANGRKINIIGIDDFCTKRSDIEKSYNGLTDGYNLVLTHDPNIVFSMKNIQYDYLLSGHFHGGQIHWPKPYHAVKLGRELVRMDMIRGLHEIEGKSFYINEGLGQTGVNIRFGSRPEITLHHVGVGVA